MSAPTEPPDGPGDRAEQAPTIGRTPAIWRDRRELAGLVRTWPPVRTVARWWDDDDPDRPTPWWLTAAALVVGVWGGVVLALFAGFLTPYRLGSLIFPVSLVFVIAGLSALTRFAYAVTRHPWLSIVPGVAWLLVTMPLATRTHEGDLVLTEQNLVATIYLLVGSVTLGVLAYRMVAPRRTPPGGQPPTRREPSVRRRPPGG